MDQHIAPKTLPPKIRFRSIEGVGVFFKLSPIRPTPLTHLCRIGTLTHLFFLLLNERPLLFRQSRQYTREKSNPDAFRKRRKNVCVARRMGILCVRGGPWIHFHSVLWRQAIWGSGYRPPYQMMTTMMMIPSWEGATDPQF